MNGDGAKIRALVTGSRGFIGRHLTSYLRSRVVEVFEWQGDIRDLPKHGRPFNVVFHLAGASRYEHFLETPHRGYEANVIGTLSVLTYCRNVGARCVFASTSGVYLSPNSAAPIEEEAPVGPKSPYTISKWLAECVCRELADSGVPSVALRLFNVYGPGQHPSFLIMRVIECLVKKQPIVLRMPDALRDFVYVADVVEAFFKAALFDGSGFRVFNIGSGKAVRVSDMIRMAERIYGSACDLEMAEPHPGELTAAIADIRRAREELEWVPTYDLEAGLVAMKASRIQR